MTKDGYKNFSKVAVLTVERVKLKNVENPKSCETNIAKRRYTPFKRHVKHCLKEDVRQVKRCWWMKLKAQKLKRSVRIM